jgi:hypothetical protein
MEGLGGTRAARLERYCTTSKLAVLVLCIR